MDVQAGFESGPSDTASALEQPLEAEGASDVLVVFTAELGGGCCQVV